MLTITLRPSRLLALLLGAMHALALASVWLLALPLAARIGAAAALLFSFAHADRHHAWRSAKNSLCALRLQGECDLAVRAADGAWHDARVLPSSFVSPYLTVLNLKLEGEKRQRHVVVLPDVMEAEPFRQLRVWLRWKCARGQESRQR